MNTHTIENNVFTPPMSDFMETDIASINPIEEVDRRASRWIVFAGNTLPPYFKRTFHGMHMGGEHLGQNFKTMGPTKGLLRRCQLTPMIVGYDYLNADSLGDDKGRVKSRTVWDAEMKQTIVTYYNECLPGDEIAGLLRTQQGANDKGIREVEVLRGVDPPKVENGRLTESLGKDVQYEIFPDWASYLSGEKEFFLTSQGLASYLRQRRSEVFSQATKEVIDVMLESNTQFERWATGELARLGRLVKAAPTEGGKIYTWEDNPSSVEWFEMLNLNREEFLMSKVESATVASNEATSEDFKAMLEIQKQNAQILKLLAEQKMSLPTNGQAGEESTFRCAGIKSDGEKCQTYVKTEGEFCRHHQSHE